MSIGYASKTLAAPGARMQSVVQRLATPDRLAQAIDGNLRALDAALDYQAKNGIRLFRISSDVIPFGSSPVNALDWMRDFEPHLAALGRKARRHGIRLSMHPGQYTVLNSPDADVVERANLKPSSCTTPTIRQPTTRPPRPCWPTSATRRRPIWASSSR